MALPSAARDDVEPRDSPPSRRIAVSLEEVHSLSWPRLFGSTAPVELEIGCGKGGFLLRRARSCPDRNFLGIEWANEFYRYTVDRFERWKVPNARILRIDASHFVRVICPADSLRVVHIYHPDPWPKARHRKRRLIQKPFCDALVRVLEPGGRVAVQTDHAEYFQQILSEMRAQAALRETAFDDPAFGVQGARVATNFEIKYVREGREIYQCAFVRST